MAKQNKPAIRFKGFTDAWEQRKVSEVAEICAGGTPSTGIEKYWHPKEIPWLSSGEVHKKYITYTDNKISVEGLNNSSARMIPANSVLIALAGQGKTRGTVAINRISLTTNQSIAAMIFSKEIVPEFVFCNLENRYEEIRRMSSGDGSRGGLNKQIVGEIEIPYTSKEEQAKIGAYFSKLDYLITLHQRKYDKLQVLKKAMLEKMFPKNGSSVPEIRFKGFTDAWEQRKLGEVVKEVTRNDPTSEAPIMMITANNGFIEQSERYAFDNAGESLKKYILLQKGELAYNHGASKLRPFGSCFALTTAESARIPFVYHCFSAENQNAEFLSIELNGSEVESQLRKIVSSGARMDGLLNISFDEYSTVTVLLPDIKEQEHIADFFRNLDHLITLHQRELEKLQNIKKSMLEKMFV